MPYVINRSNGSQLLVLDDAVLDTSTSLGLVGRNYVGYGESQNENFVWLLENFANGNPPTRPITGQLWYNTNTQSLKLYDGTEWKTAASADVGVDQPVGTPGSLWFKSDSNQLFVYHNKWVLVGPEAIKGFGETKVAGIAINDDSGLARPALEIKVDDIVVGTITKAAFTVGNPAIPGFLNLTNGITLAEGFNFKGNLVGNAASASSLIQGKTINGIVFDGTQDVSIRAATTQPLIRGTYLKGNNFDGAIARTWEVDASETASPGKIVARDSTGSIAAYDITGHDALLTNLLTVRDIQAGYISASEISAGTFIGAQLSGNALTATRLQTPPRINGIQFAGDQDITISVAAENLSGTAINNNVIASNLQSLGKLTHLTIDAESVNPTIEFKNNSNTTTGALYSVTGGTTLKSSGDTLLLKQRDDDVVSGEFGLRFVPIKDFNSINYVTDSPMSAIVPTPSFRVDLGGDFSYFRRVYAATFISNQVDTDFIRAKTTSGTITIGDNTIINGDLTVTGTTTTVNSNTVDIRDVNITLAKGAANQVAADGGGITVEGANALFYYSATGNKWNINKRLDAGDNDIITTGHFVGTATAAQYADLAENYQADADYPPGTVLEFGGTFEVTLAEDETRRVAGVVSTNPAYLMNSELTGLYVVSIALQGRVPCRVRGKIKKGDMLTSGGAGYARPTTDPKLGTIIGKALEDFDGIEGVIEVAVGRL